LYSEGGEDDPANNKKEEGNWTGQILRKNCILKHTVEERIAATGRRGRRCKQLVDDFKENREFWKLKEEALDLRLWRTRFGRGYGPNARKTAI